MVYTPARHACTRTLASSQGQHQLGALAPLRPMRPYPLPQFSRNAVPMSLAYCCPHPVHTTPSLTRHPCNPNLHPRFYQLYVNQDKNKTKKLVQTAEKAGASALFITCDAPQLGNRERDRRVKVTHSGAAEQGDQKKKVKQDQGTSKVGLTLSPSTPQPRNTHPTQLSSPLLSLAHLSPTPTFTCIRPHTARSAFHPRTPHTP